MNISVMHEYQNMNEGGRIEMDLYLEWVKWEIEIALMMIIEMTAIINVLITA